MMVSSIHFGSILVESLKIINAFQNGWLHDTVINIHHGENYRDQESKKLTKNFSEESKVYEEDPRAVDELKCKIQEEITRINGTTLRKVMDSTLKRMQEFLELASAYLKCTI